MRSYKEIARETGHSVADVREAMNNAEKREVPYCRTYDVFDNPPSQLLQGPSRYGRQEIAYDIYWVVLDKWRLEHVEGSGRTKEEAVIDALNKGYHA